MANSSGRRASSAAGKRGGKKSSGSGRKGKAPTYDYEKENELFHEIGLIIFFILMVILFLCNFGIIGPAGDLVSGGLFGLFGLTSYAVPVLLFVAVSFWYANSGNPNALRKLIAGAVLFLMVGVVCELFAQNSLSLDYCLSLASLLFTDSKYWFRYAPMRMIYIQKYIHSSTMMIMERLP